MATLQELQDRREALILKREAMHRRVQYGDKSVEYDLSRADKALQLLDSEIAKAKGRPSRRLKVFSGRAL